jgi:hypothetical protein
VNGSRQDNDHHGAIRFDRHYDVQRSWHCAPPPTYKLADILAQVGKLMLLLTGRSKGGPFYFAIVANASLTSV